MFLLLYFFEFFWPILSLFFAFIFSLLDVTISSRRLYILIFGLIDFVSRLNGGEGAPRLKLSEIAKFKNCFL